MDLFLLKFYDKRDDFDFDIVNFPFLNGDVPRRIRGMAGKFVDTLAIRKSNALLKRLFK